MMTTFSPETKTSKKSPSKVSVTLNQALGKKLAPLSPDQEPITAPNDTISGDNSSHYFSGNNFTEYA